jgi:hypothetical protein
MPRRRILTLQPVHQNYSRWRSPSFFWRFKPLRHKPELSFVLNGVGYNNLVADTDHRFENFHVSPPVFYRVGRALRGVESVGVRQQKPRPALGRQPARGYAARIKQTHKQECALWPIL